MRFVLITENFPPLRNSGAVQLRDLSREFVRQGHQLTVLLPDAAIQNPWVLEGFDGVRILRLRALRTKDIGHVRRTIAELLMPFVMMYQLGKSPLIDEQWDGVVWYSPSIFHAPMASRLKRVNGCKAYLIIRDIFPAWAVDMGLMGRGLPYLFFNAVASYQYSVADVIGVQTSGNRRYFDRWQQQPRHKLEVLQNWLDKPAQVRCSIRISDTPLAGRKIVVYAGNRGVAQGVDILLEFAERLRSRGDVGLLLVGRGSDAARLRASARERELDNVLFYDEIHPDEIPYLYAQCSAGIVALDPRHKSHNIPGKFLTYMQCGLPVLANVNAGNDLAQMIRTEKVGEVCETNQVDELLELALKLLAQIEVDSQLPARCRSLFHREFAVEKAVRQIVSALAA